MSVNKYYPMQGTNKYETVSFPITKGFMVDFGAATSSSTNGTETFPKGSIILGFTCVVTEAFETAGTGTIVCGFTGTQMLSSLIGSGAATVGDVFGKSTTSISGGITLTAEDAFDVTTDNSGAATAGKMDVFVTYVPAPLQGLSSAEANEYVST